MSATVAQIYALNPSTTIANNDLFYIVHSPYTSGNDSAIIGSNLKSLFLQPSNNLSDLLSAATARTNLGLTAFATATPPLSGTLGGTGVNNGASTITIAGSISFVGAFTFTGTLTGNTTVTFPTSGTLATTSQLITSPLTTKGDIWGWSTTNDRLPVATGNGKILQVNSAAALGLSYSTPTYPSASGTAGFIIRSDGTNNVYSQSTFADIYAASSILYANGANNVAGLATANNAFLTTSGAGVPVLSSLSNIVNNTYSFSTGGGPANVYTATLAPAATAYTTGMHVTIKPINTNTAASSLNVNGLGAIAIRRADGTTLLAGDIIAGMMAELNYDGLNFQLLNPARGTLGTATNNNATAGYVGELVTSNIPAASAVSLTTVTDVNVTTISVTAGDWDIYGNVSVIGSAVTSAAWWTSLTSATLPDASLYNYAIGITAVGCSGNTPLLRVSVAATTTVYLSCRGIFASTATACGSIFARRRR